MSVNKVLLGVVALAVLVAAVLAWRAVSDSDSDAASGSGAVSASGAGSGSAPVSAPVAGVTGDRPALATDSTGSASAGGAQVRDHRGGGGTQTPYTPKPEKPPPIHRVSPEIVGSVSKQVRSIMQQCALSLPAAARGTKPRVQGELTVALKSEQLTVTDAKLDLTDIIGAAGEPLRQCIQQKTIGSQVAAPGEPDQANYTITVSFVL